jgi:thiaminase/transcriptional activator TenA
MGNTRCLRGQNGFHCAQDGEEHAVMNETAQVPFSREAWDRNASAYETIRTMPFNAELTAGTLSEARFKHYITQDAHYLIGFGRALTLAAAKAPDADRVVQFAKSAEGAIVVERALHGSFFRQYGITPQLFETTPLSPACHHYVSYLIATAYAEPYEVLLGALLPCFWIYAEVGRDIHSRAAPDNPYRAWIDTYAGEDFHEAVRKVIAATDEAAGDASSSLRARMHAAFTRATQLEWMFWDSAFRLEAWPV